MSSHRYVCLTVDLDPLAAYHRIHGLRSCAPEWRHHATRRALPRFLELFERVHARATFFVVGRDLEDPQVRALLRSAVDAGHELGNHTEGHPYDFLDLDPGAREAEIRGGHERLTDLLGTPPQGFRAPGYHADAALLRQLVAQGYRYDSSLLPSFPYWAAKAAVMAAMRLRGRRSRARLHPPTDLLAPRRPYRPAPAHPWRRGHSELLEIPAASLVAGFPLVGTFLGELPARAAAGLGRLLGRRAFTTVEFHAIDLLGLADGGLEPLAPVQLGVRTPLAKRRAAFEALLEALCPGARCMPLGALVP